MNPKNESTITALEKELHEVMLEKSETELDVRRGELKVKKIAALTNLEKLKMEYIKLELAEKKLAIDEHRLGLEELQAKFNMALELTKKSMKFQRILGKTMLGIFPAQDKQICQIMSAAKKVSELKEE